MQGKQKETAVPLCNIMIVDDHPAVREGLSMRIEQQPDMHVCCEASGVREAIRWVDECNPDVAVIDISLKDGNGISLVKRIKGQGHPVKILVWSMHPDSLYAERAMQAGALGYINKENTTGQLLEAIRKVAKNEIYLSQEATALMLQRTLAGGRPFSQSPMEVLSKREFEIYELIGKGLSTSIIAEQLHISVNTVESHRQRIKTKLSLKSARELTNSATRWVIENS
ncbi:MAG: response regulator transcription factor [Halopseudomonas sp.]